MLAALFLAGFAFCALLAAAFSIGAAHRKARGLDIPVTVEEPFSPLSADPFVDEQCNRCGAFQMRGSVRTSCWHCGAELRSAVVAAGAPDEPTWPEAS